jgi:hypothetical protein
VTPTRRPAAAPAGTDYTTVARAVDDLTNRGFTEHFRAVGDRLVALDTGRVFAAEELVIREYYRFEGVSDPDDMAIVYAIESTGGVRGTMTDAFGVYADPAASAALAAIAIRATTPLP